MSRGGGGGGGADTRVTSAGPLSVTRGSAKAQRVHSTAPGWGKDRNAILDLHCWHITSKMRGLSHPVCSLTSTVRESIDICENE